MARGKKKVHLKDPNNVGDFRHKGATRTNNPPAGIAPTYEVSQRQTKQYAYDPHLDPQLVWAGKAEHTSFEVDVVSLHIHERISTRAILDAVRRPEPLQPDLFGEKPLPADKQIEFYRHEVDWAKSVSTCLWRRWECQIIQSFRTASSTVNLTNSGDWLPE